MIQLCGCPSVFETGIMIEDSLIFEAGIFEALKLRKGWGGHVTLFVGMNNIR